MIIVMVMTTIILVVVITIMECHHHHLGHHGRHHGHHLQCVWGEASDKTLATPDEDQLLPHRQTIGTGRGILDYHVV